MSDSHCACCQHNLRTTRANGYYWVVVVPFFQEQWSRGRVDSSLPPYSKDQTHDVLVQVIFGGEEGPLGTTVRVPTRTMSKEQFGQLIEKARELALHQYGVVLPEPSERSVA